MVGTWKLLKSVAVPSGGADSIDTGELGSYDFLKVAIYLIPSGGSIHGYMYFNGDGTSTGNYARRGCIDGGSGSTSGDFEVSPDDECNFTQQVNETISAFFAIANPASETGKQITGWEQEDGGSAEPSRIEWAFKYKTTGRITSIQIKNNLSGSSNFAEHSYITVWGASSDTVTDEKTTLADATMLANVTKTDDLSTDKGWVSNTSDWSYNATNDSIDLATIRRSTTSQEIYIDLQDSDYLGSGVNLSDSSFTVRFGKIKTNSMASSANISYSVMLSKGLQDSGTNQYSINLQHNPNSNESFVRARANSNTNNEGNSTHVQTFSSTYAPSESNTYRWEIVRDGNDFNCKVYAENDSSYSTPLETKTVTATGITDLRYILITNDSEQNHAQTADVEILGDIEVINQQSVSTAPNAGTQYRETDTRKIYRWKAESSVDATYTEDMSDTTGWSFADTGAINVTSGSLSYNIQRNGSNDCATYDFGSTISDTKFLLRFSHTPTAQSHSSGSNCIGFFGLSSTTGGQNSNQDFIGFNFASNDTDGATTKNDTTLVANSVTGQASNSHTSGTKYYEIKRNSATEVVFTVYNNSDFTGVYRTQTESSLSSSITSLRYFKVANWHASGSGSANFTGTMDDLQLWDGVNSTTSSAQWVERGTA